MRVMRGNEFSVLLPFIMNRIHNQNGFQCASLSMGDNGYPYGGYAGTGALGSLGNVGTSTSIYHNSHIPHHTYPYPIERRTRPDPVFEFLE